MNNNEITNIVNSLVDNYNHFVGPNSVVNDEEAIRLIKLLYQNADNMSEYNLLDMLNKLSDTVSTYRKDRDISCTYSLSRLCYKLSKVLIVKFGNQNAVYTLFLMSKQRMLELYLADKNYYRHVAAAFYSELDIETYSSKYGFYDAKEIYNDLVLRSKSTKVDVDHVIIAEFYANIGIQMHDKGLRSEYLEHYTSFCKTTDKFWKITKKSCENRFYNPYFAYQKLYTECMEGNKSIDGIIHSNYVMAFVVSDITSRFSQQTKIAELLGLNNWKDIVDRRKLLPSSKILLGIAFAIILVIVITLIHDRSIGWTVFVAICFVSGALSYYFMDDKSRVKIYQQALVRYDLEQIKSAAENGTWHEPVYLKQWGDYYYNKY